MPEEGDGMYDDVPLHRLIVRDPVKQEVKMERENRIPQFNPEEERKMIIIDDEADIDNGLYTVYTRRLSPVNKILNDFFLIFLSGISGRKRLFPAGNFGTQNAN